MIKKITFLYLLFLVSNINSSYCDYCWIQKSNVSSINRYAAYGFSINGKGYVCGGYYNAIAQSDTWEYEPVSNTWTQKANFPGGGRWAGADFSIGNKGYITLGHTGSSYPTSTYEFDPVANSWTAKANFPFSAQDCHGFSIGTYGYVVGGYFASSYYNTTYRFDPVNNNWTQMANYPGGTHEGSKGFEIGNIAYLVAGYVLGTTTNAMYAYDPSTNSWSVKAPIPGLSRHTTCAFEMNGKGIAGGGAAIGPVFLNDFYEYNPTSNSWTSIPSFPGQTLAYPVCYTIGSNGYIATGKYNSSTNSNQTWMLGLAPSASFSFTSTACNTSVQFTNNSTPTGLTYSWNFGDGNTSSVQDPLHNYTNPGTYNVTLVVNNGSCTDTITQTVIINSNLTASLNLTTDCSNNVFISNFSTNSQSQIWYWGDGQQTNGNTTSHNYSAPGNYTISLVLSTGSCTDTLQYQVTVNQSPSASFTILSNCTNTIQTTNNSTGGTAFTWIWGDGQSTTGFNPTHSYVNPGTYTISLIASNQSCSDTTTLPITISPAINSTFSITDNCNLTISTQNLSSGSTAYLWDFGNSITSTQLNPSYTYPTPGTYTIALIAFNGACSDTSFQTITLNTTPVSSINLNYSSCHDSIYLSSQNPSSNYYWILGDGQTSSNPSVAYSYSSPGQYNITLINSNNNCADTSYINVTTFETPSAAITVSPGCDGTILASTSTNPLWTYSWTTGDGGVYNTPTISHQYSASGTFPLNLTVSNSFCSYTDQQNVSISLSNSYNILTELDTCELITRFSIDPTPTQDVFWNFGDGSTSNFTNPEHTFPYPGVFQTQAILDPSGPCPDTVTAIIDFSNASSSYPYIPSVFTPNGDNLNDHFEIYNTGCFFENIKVFDRWGLEIFSSNDTHFKWNGTSKGTETPEGVYLYILQINNQKYHGTVTIIR